MGSGKAQASTQEAQAAPEAPTRLTWQSAWGEKLWPELTVGGVAFTAALVARVGVEGTHYPRWTRTNRFDMALYEAFGTRDGSDALRRAATSIWYISEFWPVVVDALLVTWAVDRNTPVALHLLAMDLQSLSLTGVVGGYSQLSFARERPGRDCAAREGGCKHTGSSQSFISGHTAMAFSGASLVCLQHRHLPLYGGGPADVLACAMALAGATTTGVLRLAMHAHWTSDVIAGAATGFLFGWLVPWAQHFRHGEAVTERRWAWLATPWLSRHVVGASFALRH